jgi:hypothetical protein
MSELDFTPFSDDEFSELRRGVTFSEKIVSNDQFMKAQQFRMEEILLNMIYEMVAKTQPKNDNLEPEPGDTELEHEMVKEFYRGYDEGYSEAIETLWATIQDHNDNNKYEMKSW